MSRSLLRVVSLVVLTAITSMSASRLVCALPCAADAGPATVPGAASHCSPVEAAGSRIIAADTGCDDCGRLRLAEADRVAPRTSIQATPLLLPAAAAAFEPVHSIAPLRQLFDTRPAWRGLGPSLLPLRI